MNNKFVIVGPHEGKTIVLGGIGFEAGVSAAYSHDEVKTLAPILRLYSAHPMGPTLEHAQAVWAANQAGQTPPAAPEPEPEPEPEVGTEPLAETLANEKLINAIYSLDPEDDKVWTKPGLPLVSAVEAIVGQGFLNRSVIDAALPGYDRTAARARAEA